jgi:ABC-type uncharacterized transport system substrate-binding protein
MHYPMTILHVDDDLQVLQPVAQPLPPVRFEVTRLVSFVLVAGILLSSACREELPPRPNENNASDGPIVKSLRTEPPHTGVTGHRMLLVHSYHQGYPWVDTVTEGVRSSIQGTGLELSVFYMDTKRHTDEAWKVEAGRRARKRVDEYRPDIILAADDDAQQYFATFYVNTALPIVFTGVDADPSKYGYPAANVTGIIERPHFKESLALAKRLRPIKRIAVLSCHDTTSMLALGFMKQEQLDVEVAEWLMVDDFNAWKKAVNRFNRSVDAIVIRSYQAVRKPGSSENMAPPDVAAWTREHATIPTIAFHDFEIQGGLLVGVVKSGQEYGRVPAEYAVRILDGTPPSSLPIVKPQQGIKMINRTTARRLGIPCAGEIPRGVILVSQE